MFGTVLGWENDFHTCIFKNVGRIIEKKTYIIWCSGNGLWSRGWFPYIYPQQNHWKTCIIWKTFVESLKKNMHYLVFGQRSLVERRIAIHASSAKSLKTCIIWWSDRGRRLFGGPAGGVGEGKSKGKTLVEKSINKNMHNLMSGKGSAAPRWSRGRGRGGQNRMKNVDSEKHFRW